MICPNPGPFTFTGTGTYIVGRDLPGAGVAVIDPGPIDAAHLSALLEAVEGRRVTHVLVTHTHRDHAPLARPFAGSVGAPVLGMPSPDRQVPPFGAMDEDHDAAFQPDVILSGGEHIEGDGWTLTAMATPGHASNHMAFVLEEEKALLCGDHVMGWSTTVIAPPDGSMGDYFRSLDAVIAADFATLWPTHGPPVTVVEPFLSAYRAHRLERETQILGRIRSGDRTIGTIVPALYAAVDEGLWPAASLLVLAHIIKLVDEGRVVVLDGTVPTLDASYAAA